MLCDVVVDLVAQGSAAFNPAPYEGSYMPNMFIGKGNLADAPSLKVANGERGEFKVAEMRVFFDRWTRDQETGEPVQNGGFWLPVQVYPT